MAEGRFDRAMLLDFYGELLTEKQRDCFDLHYNEDLTLSEIAEQLGISRQGVWDNIRRAEASMEDMEAKTGIVKRFTENRAELEGLRETLGKLTEVCGAEAAGLVSKALSTVEELIARG